MICLLICFSLIVKNYFGAATESMIDIHSKVSLKNLRKGPYTNDVTSFLRFFENYLFREPVNRLKNLSNFKGLPELAGISGVQCRYRVFLLHLPFMGQRKKIYELHSTKSSIVVMARYTNSIGNFLKVSLKCFFYTDIEEYELS